MGDLWPGNLVLKFDEGDHVEQVFILDWELCRPGILGMELGQFCAELVLLMRFNPEECGETARCMMDAFLQGYSGQVTPDMKMWRRMIVHLGTHMVTLTPIMGWGDKAKTQQVVKEGVKLVLEGYAAEEEWLGKCVLNK